MRHGIMGPCLGHAAHAQSGCKGFRVADRAITTSVGGFSQAEYPEMGSRICTQTLVEEATSSGTDAAPYPLGCLPRLTDSGRTTTTSV